MRQILFVCPEAPYPVLGGGAHRMASLIEYFAQRNCAVDVLTFMPFVAPEGVIRNVMTVPLPANGRSLPARVFRNAARLVRGVPPLIDRLSGFEASIREALSGKHYDLALLEHFWIAPYANLIREFADSVWCDLHNIESDFFATLADASNPLERLAHTRFSRLNRDLERRWLPRFDGCLVCSNFDRDRIESARTVVYPNTIRWCEPATVEKEPLIVFSANLEYQPNRQAVRWFFEAIWPAIRSKFPNIRWRLVGMNPHAVARIVGSDPRVEMTGAIPDSRVEIAKAQLAVVPLQSGSGTRIKILEAWAAGTAVVSTSIGARGLEAPDALLTADSAAGFTDSVRSLLEDGSRRSSLESLGRKTFENKYHYLTAWRVLDSAGILEGIGAAK